MASERFNLYTFGQESIELETDHKPLEFIYSTRSKPSARIKIRSKASARIKRWVLRLQD